MIGGPFESPGPQTVVLVFMEIDSSFAREIHHSLPTPQLPQTVEETSEQACSFMSAPICLQMSLSQAQSWEERQLLF